MAAAAGLAGRALPQRYGYRSTRLIERERSCARLLASERYIGALYDANSGHLHPLRYTLGLARAAASAGVAHSRRQPRAALRTRRAGGFAVRTAQRRGGLRTAVLAGNAWLGSTVPALQRKLMSIASYIIATEPLGEQRARELIANNAAVCDTNWILDYFRRSSRSPPAVRRPRQLFAARCARRSRRPRARACCVCSRSCATRASITPGAACSTSRSIAHRTSVAWHPTFISCRASPATASRSPASPGSWWPRPSPAPRSASTCSRACRTAISPAACCCAARHWHWRCSGIGCAIMFVKLVPIGQPTSLRCLLSHCSPSCVPAGCGLVGTAATGAAGAAAEASRRNRPSRWRIGCSSRYRTRVKLDAARREQAEKDAQ